MGTLGLRIEEEEEEYAPVRGFPRVPMISQRSPKWRGAAYQPGVAELRGGESV